MLTKGLKMMKVNSKLCETWKLQVWLLSFGFYSSKRQ